MNLSILWNIVKMFMFLVERPGEGEKKKREVLELLDELYEELNIPLPKEIFDSVVSSAIDYLATVIF